jgi:hypothetical protein
MTTEDVRVQRSKSITASSNENMVRKLPTFVDESIIEVSPEPIPISYHTSYYPNSPSESVHTPVYDYEEYALGKKYKEKLELTKQEIGWLNKFWNHANAFNSIEGCEIEIIRLYLASVKRINSFLKKEASSLSKEVEALAQKNIEIRRAQNTYFTDYDVKMIKQTVERDVYQLIYRKSEFLVRERWNHKRKIQADFYTNEQEVRTAFNERLSPVIENSIKMVSSQLVEPDDVTEIALNEINPTRWRTEFERILENYEKIGHQNSLEALHQLGRQNVKNPSVENIYYEASKHLASFDKLESLRFYLHYILHDLNSKQVDNKQLNKTIQKKLFTKQNELDSFQSIVDNLVKSKDLARALTDVSGIYATRRKHIALDINAVQLAEKQHAGTVEILSEYLKDENEPVQLVHSESAPEGEVTITITSIESETELDVQSGNVDFSPVQRQCLKNFEENGFTLSFEAIEAFAKGNGLFKNQFIDGINDRCMDLLDDVLIEEVEEGFEVNENYYKQIFPA